jgi:hypothetical protein
MKIIESTYELETFKDNISGGISYWYPMWVDDSLHPQVTQLSFIFVRGEEDYILPYQHTDCKSLDLKDIESCFGIRGDKWVFQKKKLLQTLKIEDTLDVDTSHFFKTFKTIDYRTPFESIYQRWKVKGYYDNLNQSIPILKLGEIIQGILPQYKKLDNSGDAFKWYNDIYIPLLSEIERLGIRVEPTKFIDRWPHSKKHIHNTKVYTEYNPYTITGRPSNRFGGVNFSALNKSDGTREIFLPKEGSIFLQMDYDAYHPRIIGKIVGYELPKTSVHQWLADQYGCGYDEGKGITFQLLYGGIPDEFLKIPFFKKVDEFIKVFWKNTQSGGFIQTNKRRIPLEWVDQPNAQKVFNYLLQSMETDLNIEILKKLKEEELPLPILYVYDSFLFEFDDRQLEVVKKVKETIESFGFPIKASWGMDYSKV